MLNKPLDLKFVNIIYLRPKKQPNFSTAVFPRLTAIYIEVRVPLFVTLSNVIEHYALREISARERLTTWVFSAENGAPGEAFLRFAPYPQYLPFVYQ